MNYEIAYNLAKTAHEGQTRENGKDPYLTHCERVAASCSFSEEGRIVGILHDTIEDTPLTLEDLWKNGFNIEIIKAISLLTRDKKDTYLAYILRIKENVLAKAVKIADLHDNVYDSPNGSRKDKYIMALYILEKV